MEGQEDEKQYEQHRVVISHQVGGMMVKTAAILSDHFHYLYHIPINCIHHIKLHPSTTPTLQCDVTATMTF